MQNQMIQKEAEILQAGEFKLSFVHYNPHPKGLYTGDCVKRALTKAIEIDYNRVSQMLIQEMHNQGFSVNNIEQVYGPVLRKFGFSEYTGSIQFHNKNVFQLSKLFPKGIVVIQSHKHLATMVDGQLFDSWNSSTNQAKKIWVKNVIENALGLRGLVFQNPIEKQVEVLAQQIEVVKGNPIAFPTKGQIFEVRGEKFAFDSYQHGCVRAIYLKNDRLARFHREFSMKLMVELASIELSKREIYLGGN